MEKRGLQKEIEAVVVKVQANICDNFCKYRETADEDLVCEYMREHEGSCPLDELL